MERKRPEKGEGVEYWRIGLRVGACAAGGIAAYWIMGLLGLPALTLTLAYAAFAAAYSVKGVVEGLFEGTFLPSLSGALTGLGAGLSAFFLMAAVAGMPRVSDAGWSPFLLSARWLVLGLGLLDAAHSLLKFPARNRPILRISLKSSAVLASAILLKLFWPPLPLAQAEPAEALADAVFFGLLFWAAGSALSSLSLSKKPHLRAAGRWFGAGWLMFFVGAFLSYYLHSLRGQLAGVLGQNFPLFEWVLVSSMVGVVLLAFSLGVRGMSEELRLAGWMKHRQIVSTCSEEELDELSGLAWDFVERGDKSGIAVYLVSLAGRSGLPSEAIASSLREFMNYRDVELPPLARRGTARWMQAENMRRREEVLKRAVQRLESAHGFYA